MELQTSTSRATLAFVLAGLGLAAVSGIAFAAWLDHGPRIFMSLAETGLAWCF